MAFFFKLTCLVLACLVFFSCAKLKEPKTVKVSQLVVPADEASASERQIIDKTLTEIEGVAASLGRPQQFRRIPVLVSSEELASNHRFAACFSEEGQGRFIQVNRKVLDRESELQERRDHLSTLFQVLLHEIGHCYFAREHSDESIDLRRHEVSKASYRYSGRSLNFSSMHSRNVFMIDQLRSYYVAELLGLVPVPSIEALRTYGELSIVERRD